MVVAHKLILAYNATNVVNITFMLGYFINGNSESFVLIIRIPLLYRIYVDCLPNRAYCHIDRKNGGEQ